MSWTVLAHVSLNGGVWRSQVLDFPHVDGQFSPKRRDRDLAFFRYLRLPLTDFYFDTGRDRFRGKPCSCGWSGRRAARASSTNTCAWSKRIASTARLGTVRFSISGVATCWRHILI